MKELKLQLIEACITVDKLKRELDEEFDLDLMLTALDANARLNSLARQLEEYMEPKEILEIVKEYSPLTASDDI